VVALDGPAAAGKSSVGLGAARELGLGYFDTGLLYRVLTWLALARSVDRDDAQALAMLVDALDIDVDPDGRVLREGADITQQMHQPGVDAAVSAVSAHHAVREAMRPAQRALILQPGLVMAGRDIGTVIVPEAQLKIWLNASAEERARRRAEERGVEPEETTIERAQDAAMARAAVDGLAERDRLALLMKEEGLDYSEIASALGMSVGSIGTTLSRARRRLVEQYERLQQEQRRREGNAAS